jgi:hypothetical protein
MGMRVQAEPDGLSKKQEAVDRLRLAVRDILEVPSLESLGSGEMLKKSTKPPLSVFMPTMRDPAVRYVVHKARSCIFRLSTCSHRGDDMEHFAGEDLSWKIKVQQMPGRWSNVNQC